MAYLLDRKPKLKRIISFPDCAQPRFRSWRETWHGKLPPLGDMPDRSPTGLATKGGPPALPIVKPVAHKRTTWVIWAEFCGFAGARRTYARASPTR